MDVATIELNSGKLELVNLQQSAISGVTVDPSGKRLLFSAGRQQSEMWIAENILPAK